MSELRLFVNYLQHSRNKADTDIAYPAQLSALSELDRRVVVVYNNSRLSALMADLAGRLSITRLSQPKFGPIAKLISFFAHNTLLFPWQLSSIDVVWSHWFFPRLLTTKIIPVLISSGFTSNEYAGVSDDQQRLPEVNQLRSWFTKVSLVSFPVQSWIYHFNAIDSSFADKIIFLPLLLKTTALESLQQIESKFAATDNMYLLFVGRDGERKGLTGLHQALLELVMRRPTLAATLRVTIVSATEFPHVPGLTMRQFQPLPRTEVLRLMRNSHIFCLPTRHDAYGIVFLEAMANGCAIIADDADPRTEMLDYGRCGILTDTTADSVMNAIQSVLEDRAHALQLAINAWERYCNTYSFTVNARRLLEQLWALAKNHE